MDCRKSGTITFAMVLLLFVTVLDLSSALGYDSATSCNPRATRRGRAQLLATIPCDLTIQPYCNLPGTAYPWKAVRRFVHENQGLMRRMYGDIRHISILKTEFENNEIEVDDIEMASARYSRDGGKMKSNRSDRKSKYVFSDYQNGRVNEVLTEPHFRPTTTSSSTTTTTSTTTQTPHNSTEALKSPTTPTERSTTLSYIDEIKNLKSKYQTLDGDFNDSVESNSIYENATEKGVESQSSAIKDTRDSDQISSTLKVVKIDSDPIPSQDFSTLSTTDKSTTTASSSLKAAESIDRIDPVDDDIIVENDDRYRGEDKTETIIEKSNPNNKLLLDRIDDFGATTSDEAADTKATSTSSGSQFGEEKKKSTTAQINGQGQHMEAQLFQDSIQKNNPQVMMMGRGINACPVKEEVVAPFWANNTRGEVLALLNLYPFEQYVHWEKCTHEHKQMYCRDGCRCEQQYRLHRLLAYDPHNECRGIFSDWFRFPSCCICKCYDIPTEFRVTSRSPRSMKESPLDTVQDELQRAIYDHATEDWYYRPRENEDDWLEEEEFD